MDLPKIREAAANIDRAYKAAQSAKLAKNELDLTFPDETQRRQELGGMLANQAQAAKSYLAKARVELGKAEDELHEKWAEGERARRGEGEFRVPVAARPSAPSTSSEPSSEQKLELARAIFYVPGNEDASWTQHTADDVSRVLGSRPGGKSVADIAVRGMFDAYWNEDTDSEADRIEDMTFFLHSYDDTRKARAAPVDTGGRELLAVLDPRTRPPLRLVEPEPDADAELEAIDRELDELAGGSTAAAEVVAAQRRAAKHEAHRVYDHNPDRFKLQWLQLRRGLYSARSLTNASYQARGPKGGVGPWHATWGDKWLDRDGNVVGRASNMVHSGVAQAAAQKHYDRARVTAEFTTDDDGEIAGPQPLGGTSEALARVHAGQEEEARLTREHGDRLRGEATGKARPKPSDYSAATHEATEKVAALLESVQRAHNRVEKATTKAAQKKAGTGLDNAKAKLKRARIKMDQLARADAVAWAIREYDARVERTPVQRGWDTSSTTISEEILPTPQGVTVSYGYWERPGHDSPPPPAYPGLPVTQPIGAHQAAGVIVEVNKNRSRITVRLYGNRKPEKYSWRKGRGVYLKVGDSGGSGLQLGKAVEYLDPGV